MPADFFGLAAGALREGDGHAGVGDDVAQATVFAGAGRVVDVRRHVAPPWRKLLWKSVLDVRAMRFMVATSRA